VRLRPVDVGLAAGLTAVACIDVNPDTTRSVPLALVAVVAAGSTLVLHRRWPWLPAGALLVVNLVLSATVPSGELYQPQFLAFPMLVAIYLLATAVSGRTAWLAGAGTLLLVVAGHVASPDGDLADFWPLLLWGGPWLAGRVVRRVTQDAATRLADADADRERATHEAAAAERDRIARELHDVVAHSVSVMVVRAGGQRLRLADKDVEAATAFADIEQAGREALTELRAMLGVLRAPGPTESPREPLPGSAAIDAMVDRLRGAGQHVDLVEFEVPPDLPAGVSLGAYRVIQEALTNALRYGSGPVELAVGARDEVLRITARNAVGSGRADGAGRGLAGMRERVRLLGGTLAAGEDAGTWTLDARLPISAAAQP
jgi:signal transduction histidine kinase